MKLKQNAQGYLRTASELYDSNRVVLEPMACQVRDFRGGAEWMALAISVLRSESDTGATFTTPGCCNCWGLLKYGVSLIGALLMLYPAIVNQNVVMILFVPVVFYALEVQTVFLFPLLLDGSSFPLRESRVLLAKWGGTVIAMLYVTQFAAHMIIGGFVGEGFTRSWCVGCLAVLLCYEELRGNQSMMAVPLEKPNHA